MTFGLHQHTYNTRGLFLSVYTSITCSQTPYHTGDKHTISTFVDRTHIQRTRPRRKTVFVKTSLPVNQSLCCPFMLLALTSMY